MAAVMARPGWFFSHVTVPMEAAILSLGFFRVIPWLNDRLR
jgi:hypothetical protein